MPTLRKDKGSAATQFCADMGSAGIIVASDAELVNWSLGGQLVSALNTGITNGAVGEAVLATGQRLTFTTIGILAADQWSAGQCQVEEWACPNP